MEILNEDWIYQKSSQEITSLLYEALIDNLTEALNELEKDDFITTNQKLQKANDILERLGVGINYEAGVIANQLDTLYNYMANRLVEGNLYKNRSVIKEVLEIVEQLADAWNQALKGKPSHIQSIIHKQTNAYEKNILTSEQPVNSFVGEK
ncbi:flagellar export chaperone FliS [Heyndrickxia sp. NPDC080065]|uniref:flagellar export chaperone FliS n=1 Tax=Heyndrickxia sp. NPDC080065 TaxID=3390568 RepID=UPI003CFEE5B5